jgi:hypothetical protein
MEIIEFIGQLMGLSIVGWFFYSFIIKPIFIEKGASEEEKKGIFLVWILPPIVTILLILFFSK